MNSPAAVQFLGSAFHYPGAGGLSRVRIGQANGLAAGDANALPAPPATSQGFLEALPSLLLFGVTTGAAFAIGAGLVERYLLPRHKT